MAFDTFLAPVMQSWRYGRNFRSRNVRIVEERMATQAQLALGVARQILDIVGVVAGRSVTVFTFESPVW
jgi:hypothetical protein